jgi:hypothetical protein
MNHRLTLVSAGAVILASVAEFTLIRGGAWLVTAAGAVIVVALAGTLTRLNAIPAGIGATLLGLAASAPLFVAQSNYLKAAGVVIVAACAVSMTRLRLFTPVASLVTYLSALLLYLNIQLSGRASVLRVIPTNGSLRHLINLANATASLTKIAPPPVSGTDGVRLLAAAGVGLAAVAVDFLAVRVHRPAMAGLPLLVLFMAPITTTAGFSGGGAAIAFLCAAAGYMALLSADGRDRLRGWGRVVTVWHYAGDDDRLGGAEVGALAATGRRIGVAAVCVAIVAPLLLPTLNVHHLFGGGVGKGNGQNVQLPNPVDELDGILTESTVQPVLTYRTAVIGSAAQFHAAQQYLQVYVLNYDPSHSRWDLIPSAHGSKVGGLQLQPPAGIGFATPQVTTQTEITLGSVSAGLIPGHTSPVFFLPAPYWPERLAVPGAWEESNGTLMIYSFQDNHANMQYTAISENVNPTQAMLEVPQHLPASITSSYLGYASPVTKQLKAIADRISTGHDDAFSKALALEDWFLSGQFTYSRHPNLPNTPAGLLAFLTTHMQGYCQQFAFAFAVLARLIGIPSRVAIGYTAGLEGKNGVWHVTTADAHAWPELYFANVGWIRFEPTPGGPDGQGTAVQPSYLTSQNSGPSTGPGTKSKSKGSSKAPTTTTKPHPPRLAFPEGGSAPPIIATSGASNTSDLVLLIVIAILALAGATPGATRALVRRRRWRRAASDAALAHVAWQEICDDLDDFGLPRRPSESPRTVARRICADTDIDHSARQAVGRIASAVEQARYAPDPQAVGPIRADVTMVRRALGRDANPVVRWRARLLPASTLGPVRSGLRQAVGLLIGWVPSGRENAPA